MLHDNALLARINLSVLIDTSHELVVSLFILDFLWEPFLQEGCLLRVEVVYTAVSESFWHATRHLEHT